MSCGDIILRIHRHATRRSIERQPMGDDENGRLRIQVRSRMAAIPETMSSARSNWPTSCERMGISQMEFPWLVDIYVQEKIN